MISSGTNQSQRPWHWAGYSFKAMNTKVQTWLFSQTDSPVLLDVQRLFHSFEKRLSRFDPQSELSRFNTSEAGVFQVSPILLDAVEAALIAAETTRGLYDPTLLTALEQAGYDRSFDQIAHTLPLTDGAAFDLLAVAPAPIPPRFSARPFTFRSITINRARREIYKPGGLRLDLGGMGKGWTVDRAADRLQGLGPFLINAGGDIFAYHSPPGQKGWEIDLIHPLKPEENMARLLLHHRALADRKSVV